MSLAEANTGQRGQPGISRVCPNVSRRAPGPHKLSPVIEVRNVRLDLDSHRVWVDGDLVSLAPMEYRLLRTLMVRAGDVVTRPELLHEVWGQTLWTTTKTIDVHRGWLRRKLRDDPRHPRLITTVRGKGLRFAR